MIDAHDLKTRIEQAIPSAQVQIEDLTGGGDHFRVRVISPAFAGVPPLKRHRMVYAPLKDILGGALHALALDTKTPEEMAA